MNENESINFFDKFSGSIVSNINVCMIGKIQTYDDKNNTANIVPLHMVPGQEVPYPPLTMVPIGNFSMGGYNFKVKPKDGDILILLFADYDIDNILADGQSKTSQTDRKHAIQDCIALPLSINFLNNAYNATEDLTIGKDDGSTVITIEKGGNIVLKTANKVYLGDKNNTEPLALANSIKEVFDSHTHSTPDGETGAPNQKFPKGSSKVEAVK